MEMLISVISAVTLFILRAEIGTMTFLEDLDPQIENHQSFPHRTSPCFSVSTVYSSPLPSEALAHRSSRVDIDASVLCCRSLLDPSI